MYYESVYEEVGHEYFVWARVLAVDGYGLNGGRVIELQLWDNNTEVAIYDSGWVTIPSNRLYYNLVMDVVNSFPTNNCDLCAGSQYFKNWSVDDESLQYNLNNEGGRHF